MYYVYILKSLRDNTLYKGQTENLEVRLKQHNSGKSDYTSRKAPWKLVYFEEYNTREEALMREKFLKTAGGRKFVKQLNL